MRTIARLSVLFLATLSTACSIDAEILAGSLYKGESPDDDPNQKKPYTAGTYITQFSVVNGLESFVLKMNSTGGFDTIEKADQNSFAVYAAGKSLLSIAIDFATSKYSIYRLTGLQQTEILTNVFDAAYGFHFAYQEKLYVRLNDDSLVRIDENGTKTTVCSNCPISDKRIINSNGWGFFSTYPAGQFILGPLHSLSVISLPTLWTPTSDNLFTNIGNTLYVVSSNTTAGLSGVIKIANGVSSAIPTTGAVSSLATFANDLYITADDNGRQILYKIDSSDTVTMIADLGDTVANPSIIEKNDSGLYIVKFDTGNSYELFFYDGAFVKLTAFQLGNSNNPIFNVLKVKDGITYKVLTLTDYYFTNKTLHQTLTNATGCLSASSNVIDINNVTYTVNNQTSLCRLKNDYSFESILTLNSGMLTEIK